MFRKQQQGKTEEVGGMCLIFITGDEERWRVSGARSQEDGYFSL